MNVNLTLPTLTLKSMPAAVILGLLDYTLLDLQATEARLSEFEKKANQIAVAAVCLYPNHLAKITTPPGVKRATVVNFPSGSHTIQTVISEIEHALSLTQVDEIDYVFPYQQYLSGEEQSALQHCQIAYETCAAQHKTFKVIIETGAFEDQNQLFALARKLIHQGCNFLKTSTGKFPIGATPQAAYTLLQAIQAEPNTPCGIKLSGGVKTIHDALYYISLAEYCLKKEVNANWFRIGSSSLITI